MPTKREIEAASSAYHKEYWLTERERMCAALKAAERERVADEQENSEDRLTVSARDMRFGINMLLEKIATKFEANDTFDMWRSDAAALVRSFKHRTPTAAVSKK